MRLFCPIACRPLFRNQSCYCTVPLPAQYIPADCLKIAVLLNTQITGHIGGSNGLTGFLWKCDRKSKGKLKFKINKPGNHAGWGPQASCWNKWSRNLVGTFAYLQIVYKNSRIFITQILLIKSPVFLYFEF